MSDIELSSRSLILEDNLNLTYWRGLLRKRNSPFFVKIERNKIENKYRKILDFNSIESLHNQKKIVFSNLVLHIVWGLATTQLAVHLAPQQA